MFSLYQRLVSHEASNITECAHAKRVERHPSGSISLAKLTTSRQRFGAVEDANVVEAKETTTEYVVAALVLTVDPPRKVEHEFLKDALEELQILATIQLALDLENAERCPGVHWWVDVAEVPFVCRQSTIGLR